MNYGIITESVVAVRKIDNSKSEMVNQLLFGEKNGHLFHPHLIVTVVGLKKLILKKFLMKIINQ